MDEATPDAEAAAVGQEAEVCRCCVARSTHATDIESRRISRSAISSSFRTALEISRGLAEVEFPLVSGADITAFTFAAPPPPTVSLMYPTSLPPRPKHPTGVSKLHSRPCKTSVQPCSSAFENPGEKRNLDGPLSISLRRWVPFFPLHANDYPMLDGLEEQQYQQYLDTHVADGTPSQLRESLKTANFCEGQAYRNQLSGAGDLTKTAWARSFKKELNTVNSMSTSLLANLSSPVHMFMARPGPNGQYRNVTWWPFLHEIFRPAPTSPTYKDYFKGLAPR